MINTRLKNTTTPFKTSRPPIPWRVTIPAPSRRWWWDTPIRPNIRRVWMGVPSDTGLLHLQKHFPIDEKKAKKKRERKNGQLQRRHLPLRPVHNVSAQVPHSNSPNLYTAPAPYEFEKDISRHHHTPKQAFRTLFPRTSLPCPTRENFLSTHAWFDSSPGTSSCSARPSLVWESGQD